MCRASTDSAHLRSCRQWREEAQWRWQRSSCCCSSSRQQWPSRQGRFTWRRRGGLCEVKAPATAPLLLANVELPPPINAAASRKGEGALNLVVSSFYKPTTTTVLITCLGCCCICIFLSFVCLNNHLSATSTCCLPRVAKNHLAFISIMYSYQQPK